MTQPVYNMQAPLVKIVADFGYLIKPWNSLFQQFTQSAPAVDAVTAASPFTANVNGKVILTSAVTITLTRGLVSVSLTGERIIPVRIGDTVSWTGPAVVQFWGD